MGFRSLIKRQGRRLAGDHGSPSESSLHLFHEAGFEGDRHPIHLAIDLVVSIDKSDGF